MRITHPRPQLGRLTALGVDFTDGVATVESLHPERELALLQHGYTIEADPEIEQPFHAALGEPFIDLTSLTVAALRDIAETEGVDLPTKARKPEIIEILSRQPAAPIVGDIDNDNGTFTSLGVTDGFATVELPDGTVLGDGESIATLPPADPDSDIED
ncbi:Rho termination factor N-terminal domain-containing protein [Microbacterium sp. STF-2]|uniref:Rho termination factor N-terminal domain-containing protein n=1 Tax=Microbacterium sp. STF-2 TaxID=3031132 RepID=UPI002AFF374A|nr:Rho termination factor N-terminal domain-containing protein [Microbacterium sp. STF-2]MEA1264246.1 Rho termination factor N-terminal domain-containing protein [Microbacterium sp. STF-2]